MPKIINWKRLWYEHQGWLDETGATWRGEQRHIRKLVSKQVRYNLNWKQIWREFNKWFTDLDDKGRWPNWNKQKHKIEELVGE